MQPDQLPRIIDIIDWVSNGFLEQNFKVDDPDADSLYEEFSEYLTLLKTHFYVSDTDEKVSVAKEEVYERNETVMKEMRLDMTFEERLMAGKKPLVEGEEEPEAEEGEESKASDEDVAKKDPDAPETFDDIMREAEKNISES